MLQDSKKKKDYCFTYCNHDINKYFQNFFELVEEKSLLRYTFYR